jgi:alkylhydroperoxidase family enzyme
MARLPYVDPEQAPPEVRRALEAMPDLNIFRLLANAQTVYRPLLRTASELLTTAELDDRLRELAILQVAHLSCAEYEWIQHVAIGKTVGVTDAQVAALQGDDPRAECFDETDRLVLEFTTEVVHNVAPSDDTFNRAAAAFSPREIVELILSIGMYMTLARVMETAQIDLDEPVGSAVIDGARGATRDNAG